MNAESQEKLTCDVCEKTFRTVGALTKHTNRTNAHDGMRRNVKNELVFACNVCNKAYSSQGNLYKHRYYAKHALMDSTIEPAVNKITSMEKPTENTYSSDGRIRNEISHEKERVIELSTSLTLGNVQDAVKRAFRSVREEIGRLRETTTWRPWRYLSYLSYLIVIYLSYLIAKIHYPLQFASFSDQFVPI